MNVKFPRKTAVVCHDAGAANIVIAMLMNVGGSGWLPCMEGPARKLWKSAFPTVVLFDSVDQAMEEAELLITGTGWASDIEHEARRKAQAIGLRSIAVIDHWVNYGERFIRNDVRIFPDEIWVTDRYALEIAQDTFPKKSVLQIPNYYLENQIKYIASLGKPRNPELLYILEPVRSNWGRDTPGEFQALEYFISKLPALGLPDETAIYLRPHPSDSSGKYNDWIKTHSNINIKLDNSADIAESLGRATWVAGCESFGLVLALMANRTVYCTMPPWAPLCRLPHSDLIQLRELAKQR